MANNNQSLPTDVAQQNINPDIQPTSDCMKYEWMRLGSFKSFPRQSVGRPIKLAKAGFVFTGTRDDSVTCFTCGVTKNSWMKYEDPLQVHKDLNPRCNFINETSENFPILVPESIVYDKILTTLHETYCDRNPETRPFCTGITSRIPDPTMVERSDINPAVQVTADRTEPDINQEVQVTDDRTGADGSSRMVLNQSTSSASVVLTGDSTRQTMVLEEARLTTFGNWPRYLAVRPAEGADTLKCSFCGGVIKPWRADDIPWNKHAKWFPKCPYFPMDEGQEIIYPIRNPDSGTALGVKDEDVEDYDLSLVNSHKRMCLHLKLNIKKEDVAVNTGSWDSISNPTEDMSCASQEFNSNDGTNLHLHEVSMNGRGQEVFGEDPACDSVISNRTDIEAAVETVGFVNHESSDSSGIMEDVQELHPNFNDASCSLLAPVSFGVRWLYNRCI